MCGRVTWSTACRLLIRVTRYPRALEGRRSRPATCSAPAGRVSSLLKRSGATAAGHTSHRLLRVPPADCSPFRNHMRGMMVQRAARARKSGYGSERSPEPPRWTDTGWKPVLRGTARGAIDPRSPPACFRSLAAPKPVIWWADSRRGWPQNCRRRRDWPPCKRCKMQRRCCKLIHPCHSGGHRRRPSIWVSEAISGVFRNACGGYRFGTDRA